MLNLFLFGRNVLNFFVSLKWSTQNGDLFSFIQAVTEEALDLVSKLNVSLSHVKRSAKEVAECLAEDSVGTWE